MAKIEELEYRINTALERIGHGLESLGQAADSAELASLRSALEDERAANMQLEERLKTLRERTSTSTVQLEQKAERLQGQLATAEEQIAQMRAMNEKLQVTVESLRRQNEASVGDPHLVNKAMMVELEALRTARAGDLAEMDAILDEMAPLVGEG